MLAVWKNKVFFIWKPAQKVILNHRLYIKYVLNQYYIFVGHSQNEIMYSKSTCLSLQNLIKNPCISVQMLP